MARAAFIPGLLLLATLVQAQQLQRGEYFVDADPGFGNAIPISFTSAAQVDLQVAIPMGGLSPGGHILGIRMKDNAGNWGLTNRRAFTVAASVVGGNLVAGEYFFDNDPGIGNATPFSFPAAQQIAYTQAFPMASLSPGGHVLGLRLRDIGGHWGLTNRRVFIVQQQAPGGDITTLEYFLDVDPGFGNGVMVTTTAAPVITDLLFDVLTDTLSGGAHTLFVRAWSEHGAVSITNALSFDVLVGINELAAHGIRAWPNPMVKELFLQRDDFATPLHLTLLDAQGRSLLATQWAGAQFHLQVGQLSAGNYLLVLQREGKVPLVLKLVKP
ncbi:MAG: T9SS type A sorting domain-containing protein [Flavobacteriales bacterium]|nr:T9SS type A sorting domain-containing protein [Flavobacteriales bacterium]